MKVLLFLLSISVCMLSACTESQTLTFKTQPIDIVATGPLLEGANTAQGEFMPQIAAYLKQQGLDNQALLQAELQKVSIVLPDSLNSDMLSEITFQMAADQVDMQKVAVLNPIPAAQTHLSLQVAREQKKIADLLRQDKVLLVVDANLKKDLNADWHGQAILEFLLTIKK